MSEKNSNILLIAGGVGGAKMAQGLAALPDINLSIIGNIADDDNFHGLWVSPDIDTLTYTLSGLINREQGWGVKDEALRALDVLKTLGEDTWMTLGDKDFGLHIYRTMRRLKGDRPSDIARDVAQKFGVAANIILPSDDVVQTRVKTPAGWLSFQEYFVKEKCAPEVLELRYQNIENAKATNEALTAIHNADLIIIAPSNPLVSITPILNIDGISEAIKASGAPVAAVSPLIAGKVVKGPADKMMQSLGLRADVLGIAQYYQILADHLFIDDADIAFQPDIKALGMACTPCPILMKNDGDKAHLARKIIAAFQIPARGAAA